ncbi:hypothetical protein LG3211_0167 [Lysobacter gummosus]|nr:hypothetical protein LG3211_0167 [Lysobacter gummosus]
MIFDYQDTQCRYGHPIPDRACNDRPALRSARGLGRPTLAASLCQRERRRRTVAIDVTDRVAGAV